MCRMLVAFMLFGVAALAYAEDITTTDGITYTNAEVHRVEPDGITVMHSGGVAKIQPAKLPDDVRETGETGDVLCNYLCRFRVSCGYPLDVVVHDVAGVG